MGSRGRTSMNELMIPENPTEIVQRPDAPYDLTDVEADEWRAIVAAMPADHFMRGNYALLSQHCRHVVSARRIAQLIEQTASEKPFNRREYMILLQMQATESAAIMRLSRSMRLTQQAVKRPDVKQNGKRSRAPWDAEDE